MQPLRGTRGSDHEPRLNQVFVPLLSIVGDPKTREEMRALARKYNGETAAERGMGVEVQVLEVIRDMAASSIGQRLSVKDITSWFADRNGEEYGRQIASKYIGSVIRRRLRLKTRRASGSASSRPRSSPGWRLSAKGTALPRRIQARTKKCKGRQAPEGRFGSLAESRVEGR